ncbi:hypothetical protein ACH4D4_31695 [Streptomyces pristinaespiralis]
MVGRRVSFSRGGVDTALAAAQDASRSRIDTADGSGFAGAGLDGC